MARRIRQKQMIEEALMSDPDDIEIQQQNQFSFRSFRSFRRAGRAATLPQGGLTMVATSSSPLNTLI